MRQHGTAAAPDPSPRLRFVVISERGQRNQERAVPRRLGSVRARRGVFAIFIAQHPRRRRAPTPASVADPQRWGLVPARPSWGQENAGYGRRAQLQPSRGHAPPLTPTGRGRETAVGPAGRGAEGASDPEGQGPEPRSHGDHSASIAHHPARLEARAGAGNHQPILGPGKVA